MCTFQPRAVTGWGSEGVNIVPVLCADGDSGGVCTGRDVLLSLLYEDVPNQELPRDVLLSLLYDDVPNQEPPRDVLLYCCTRTCPARSSLGTSCSPCYTGTCPARSSLGTSCSPCYTGTCPARSSLGASSTICRLPPTSPSQPLRRNRLSSVTSGPGWSKPSGSSTGRLCPGRLLLT